MVSPSGLSNCSQLVNTGRRSSVNSIVGAQLLHAVNNDVPGWAGIIVIAVCTWAVTLFGYKVVHVYEFWSWIPSFIIFLIVLGVFAHSGDYVHIPWETGTAEMGSVLSFGSVIFGFAIGWSSYAADYTCYQPSSQSKVKVFGWTFLGLIFPLLFTQMLGVAVMSATALNDGNNRYQDGYKASSTGGLLGAVLIYHLGGFGKFCLVMLALSIIANNCPNIYSVGLTVQVLGRWIQWVPRFVWTTIATGAYIAIAIPGYSHFEAVLENFMNFIGYWLAIYSSIGLTEHFVFKRGFSGYRPENYDVPEKLPPGIAAVFAFCCGVIGMVAGMSQVWWYVSKTSHAQGPNANNLTGLAGSLCMLVRRRTVETSAGSWGLRSRWLRTSSRGPSSASSSDASAAWRALQVFMSSHKAALHLTSSVRKESTSRLLATFLERARYLCVSR